MAAPAEPLLAFSTAPDEACARDLARALVERRLAGCVNWTPVRSAYRWEGAVQEEGEALLLIKTDRARLDELRRTLDELHPYDLPELIAVPIGGGSAAYLQWLGEAVSG